MAVKIPPLSSVPRNNSVQASPQILFNRSSISSRTEKKTTVNRDVNNTEYLEGELERLQDEVKFLEREI